MKKPERQTYFFSQLSGNAEGKQPWAKIDIRFLFAFRKYPFSTCRCQVGCAKINGQKCHLNLPQALRRRFRKPRFRDSQPGWARATFVIIGIRCNPPSGAIV
jgi:hypothetical protein